MDIVAVARATAVVLSAATSTFIFVSDSWTSDNLFLVPDLILCALLLFAALLPATWAAPMLVFAFGTSAGVLGTAVSSYAVQGRLGVASLIGTVVAVAMAVLLIRSRPQTRS